MEKQLKIASVINNYKLVINAGANQNICVGQKYLVYALDTEEIIDPDTKESLGFLEIVKGTGKVTHVQEKMCTIESTEYKPLIKKIKRKNYPMGLGSALLQNNYEEVTDPEHEQLPFNNPKVGDLVKRVN